MIKKNDLIELEIEDIGYNGEGIAHYDGLTIFIKNAIVAEKIIAKIILVKKTFAIAIVQEFIKTSDKRVLPPCKFYLKCGGCDYQHINYNEQLKLKHDSIKTTITKILDKNIDISNVIASDKQLNYRNKLSLPIIKGDLENDIIVGFYAKGTHRIVEIDECILQLGSIKDLILLIKKFCKDNNLNGYDADNNIGDIRQLVIRELGGIKIITIVGVNKKLAHSNELLKLLTDLYSDKFTLYYNQNDKPTNVIFGKTFEFIGGKRDKIEVDGLKIDIHPASFFQVNDYIREQIYKKVIDLCIKADNDNIIDAYSGIGLLGAKLSSYFEEITCIEISKEACENAKQILKDNDIQNVVIECQDVNIALSKSLTKYKQNATVVLDPPRKGCEKTILEELILLKVNDIIYISCNPATLARDIQILSEEYFIEEITPYDMFAQTANVEMVCRLTKK